MPFPNADQAPREYHTVHVTVIAGVIDPSYFGRTADTMPTLVVTTGDPLSKEVLLISADSVIDTSFTIM